ncbi:TPA: hypothetical protein NGT43_000787 [Vibrio parahaemolyticus]|uniref:hypothetical protein n=1 Tax=Vibrio parahaemolyticus TaxID=670 RepID=UPI0003FA1D76|nr:hypothetical protein [Vibrio parahaemolyticus]HCE2224694.1 hypothetical protein [Vibrio parahaemolyticus]
MNQNINTLSTALSESEFKREVIGLIKSPEYTPELLNKLLLSLLTEKPDFFDDYLVDDKADAIVEAAPGFNSSPEWCVGGYFDRQCRFLAQNFSKQRIEHLIQVKSHLIEYGIKGFEKIVSLAHTNDQHNQSEENLMKNQFASEDLSNFAPSSLVQKIVNSGDLIRIREGLFMEMNDHGISTRKMRQIIAYAMKHKPNLFVPYENNGYAGEMDHDNKNHWDAKYYALQEVYTASNFSYQRIEHLLKVRDHVFNIAAHQPSVPPRSVASQQSQPSSRYPNSQARNSPRPGVGLHQPQTKVRAQSERENLKAMLLVGGVLAAAALFILLLL